MKKKVIDFAVKLGWSAHYAGNTVREINHRDTSGNVSKSYTGSVSVMYFKPMVGAVGDIEKKILDKFGLGLRFKLSSHL